MESIDPNLKIKYFQSQIDVMIAELNQAKQEAQTIAGFASRNDPKTYANVAFIKSKAVLAYCVSVNKRLQVAYKNAQEVHDALRQAET